VANALAAIAVGLACELPLTDIRDGLEGLAPVLGRLRTLTASCGARVIDDCYNANPGSVRAAIDLLSTCPGRRTLLLGAMRELGEESEALHREVGEYARAAGLDRLWGVGPELLACVQAFGDGGCHFSQREAAIAALEGAFDSADTVLVKGSRGARMEEVMAALLPAPAAGEG
jgi:UDP-N-acetylmuramoyl-tripeptide--D-alanyl-D-alanine ligase